MQDDTLKVIDPFMLWRKPYPSKKLQTLTSNVPAPYTEVFSAFKTNFASAEGIATFPRMVGLFTHLNELAIEAASQSASQMKLVPRQDGVSKSNLEGFGKLIRDNLHNKLLEGGTYATEDKVLERLSGDGLYVLMLDENIGNYLHELLLQGLVLSWGTLEVFMNDLLASLINNNPNLYILVVENGLTKKRFTNKASDPEILKRCNYNLSNSLGDILLEDNSLKEPNIMADVFSLLGRQGSAVERLLRSTPIWLGYQRRNLIVHRRGIIDEKYLRATPDRLQVGTKLRLTTVSVLEFLELVSEIGCAALDLTQDGQSLP